MSASVAKLEHRAILESLVDFAALEPGLYEMKINNPTGNPDCHKPEYSVRFEPREVSDIGERREDPAELANVKRVSELNEAAYSLFFSPWITAISNPVSAEVLKRMHPMRVSRMVFSEQFNPWMILVRSMAGDIGENRTALPADDSAIIAERAAFETISQHVKSSRISRDQAAAAFFGMLFGDST